MFCFLFSFQAMLYICIYIILLFLFHIFLVLRLHTFELLTCLFTWLPFYNFGSHSYYIYIFFVISFSFQSQLIPTLLSLLNGSGQMSILITLEYVYTEILGSTINSYCVGSAQECDVFINNAIVWNPKYKNIILI